jgi:hypothetical protein
MEALSSAMEKEKNAYAVGKGEGYSEILRGIEDERIFIERML